MALSSIIKKASQAAKSKNEVSTLAHVLVDCMGQQNIDVLDLVTQRIRKYYLPQVRRDPYPDEVLFSYTPEEAIRSYESFKDQQAQRLANFSELSESVQVIVWLLEGDFLDPVLSYCRKECADYGINRLLFSDTSSSGGFSLGLEFRAGAQLDLGTTLVGRESDLSKHLSLLAIAIRTNKHHALVGAQGIGKSTFAKELLNRAVHVWPLMGDDTLGKIRLLYLNRFDFSGGEDEIRVQIEKLDQYLARHPEVVPVIDDIGYFLNENLNVYEEFWARFGGMITSKNRSFFFVGSENDVSKFEALREIQVAPLNPLTLDETKKVVREQLHTMMNVEGVTLRYEESEDTFCNYLLNLAVDRYPGRFFPEIGIHLARSAVIRALHRSKDKDKKTPKLLKVSDLWQHVAEEKGIGTEILGKNPEDFYANVEIKLKERVIGQDHAIEKICKTLLLKSKFPPERIPRGRFLFVGPPGVGKTELGRSLAMALGYGEEAFYRFNMSEFSSDSARTRFMGADPGYVGFNRTNTIYDVVKLRPSCVVLLDEIDRAHPSIQDILLSILEGEGKNAVGEKVYFSQVIFIMTTNLGQEVVSAKYERAREQQIERYKLALEFEDSTLRELILDGVVDDVEASMKSEVRILASDAKEGFTSASEESTKLALIQSYLGYKQLLSSMESIENRSPLDRAFLDRIDVIVPFFPIKERPLLQRILKIFLASSGWPDCPDAIQQKILDEVTELKESIRPLQRLIASYRLKHFSTI